MPRSEKRYHFLYKTTNLKNGRYYLGMHSTSKLDDGYLGSGKRLRRSIRKYGKENFKVEILEFFKSREDLIIGEKKLITEDTLKDKLCMNLKPGGSGGFNNKEHQLKCSISGKSVFLEKLQTDEIFSKKFYDACSNSNLINPRGFAANKTKRCDWSGRKHKDDSKRLIGDKNSINQKGSKNSQFGSFWITNGIESVKLKKDSIIPDRWWKGRNKISDYTKQRL